MPVHDNNVPLYMRSVPTAQLLRLHGWTAARSSPSRPVLWALRSTTPMAPFPHRARMSRRSASSFQVRYCTQDTDVSSGRDHNADKRSSRGRPAIDRRSNDNREPEDREFAHPFLNSQESPVLALCPAHHRCSPLHVQA